MIQNDYTKLADLYSQYGANNVPLLCDQVVDYLSKHPTPNTNWELDDSITFIKDLRVIFQKTLQFENYVLCIYHSSDGEINKANIHPLLDYLVGKEDKVEYHLSLVKDFLIDRLNHDNIDEFKALYRFVDELIFSFEL